MFLTILKQSLVWAYFGIFWGPLALLVPLAILGEFWAILGASGFPGPPPYYERLYVFPKATKKMEMFIPVPGPGESQDKGKRPERASRGLGVP